MFSAALWFVETCTFCHELTLRAFVAPMTVKINIDTCIERCNDMLEVTRSGLQNNRNTDRKRENQQLLAN